MPKSSSERCGGGEGSAHDVHDDVYIIFKASQPRGRASGSRAYGRHEMQGVIIKCTRHECMMKHPDTAKKVGHNVSITSSTCIP